MAKKQLPLNESNMAIIAAVFVLVAAMLAPAVSIILALIIFLGFAAYKYQN